MKKALYILIILLSMSICNKISAYTEYKIGDVVTYNDIDFYVIKDSGAKEDSVTMLKAEPLSYSEVQTYSSQTGVTTYHNINGYYDYGCMIYYSSSDASYDGSYIKTTVDAWKNAKAPAASEARLITIEELKNNLGYEFNIEATHVKYVKTESTPGWGYSSTYWYWTMSPYSGSSSLVWVVGLGGDVSHSIPYNYNGTVRPVITLSKTALGDAYESIVDNNSESDGSKETEEEIKDNDDKKETKASEKDGNNKPSESKITVKVSNTYMSSSIMLIILGFIIASISVFIIYKLSNKKK